MSDYDGGFDLMFKFYKYGAIGAVVLAVVVGVAIGALVF